MLDIKLEQQYIIDLVSYTLFDTPFDFNKYENKELDYKYIATKIHEQKMEGLVYHAMSMLKINNNLYNHLHNRYMTILYTCVQQENEYQELVKLFETNNIDYVPLKGTFMKHYYPKMEMRLMGDIDVLIQTKEKNKVHKMLIQNKYNSIKYNIISTHHNVYSKGDYCTFEIHYKLLDDRSRSRNKIEKLAWENTHNHRFDNEFNIVYLLAHYHHHFEDGGASFKPLIDIGLLLLKEDIDYDKLKNLLLNTKFYTFYNKCIQLFNHLFNQNIFIYNSICSDNELRKITDFIFKCGDFGYGKENDNSQNKMISEFSKNETVTKKSKFKYALSRVFISYSEFKRTSKLIKYCPILLPFGWIIRFFKFIFTKKNGVKEKMNTINSVSNDNLSNYKTINSFLKD